MIFSGFLPDKREQLIQSKINPNQNRISSCTSNSVICKLQRAPAFSSRVKATAPLPSWQGCTTTRDVIDGQQSPQFPGGQHRPRVAGPGAHRALVLHCNWGGAEEAEWEDEERHSRHQLLSQLLQESAAGAQLLQSQIGMSLHPLRRTCTPRVQLPLTLPLQTEQLQFNPQLPVT